MKLFGIELTEEEANVVITPVPWDVTTSYGEGTRLGPDSIRKASGQIDHFSFEAPEDYEHKYFLRETNEEILNKSVSLRRSVGHLLAHDLNHADSDKQLLQDINRESDKLNDWVYEETKKTLSNNKVPGTLGGDHSIPYGSIKAVAEHYNNDYAILHIDAHYDLRKAFMGFTHSHASIFYNVMTSDFEPKSLVQMGIRDFCKEEFDFAKQKNNLQVYYDRKIKEEIHAQASSWLEIAKSAIEDLDSENVYISLDIDGFDPKLCPHTGTPVLGGIDFDHFLLLLKQIKIQSKKIVGFDLVEVSPDLNNLKDEWDANVGMRVLFELCKYSCLTQDL